MPWRRDSPPTPVFLGFPGYSGGIGSTCSVGDLGLNSGLGIFPGGGHSNPLHILAWRIPMDRVAWWTTVHGVTKSHTWLIDKAQHRPRRMGEKMEACLVPILNSIIFSRLRAWLSSLDSSFICLIPKSVVAPHGNRTFQNPSLQCSLLFILVAGDKFY